MGSPTKISHASDPKTGGALPMQIHRFKDQPCEGAITWSTVGLSDHIYTWPDGRTIRHELLYAAYETIPEKELYPLFFGLGDWMLKRKEGLIEGEIFDTGKALMEGSPLQGFWFYMPVYFKEALYECKELEPLVVFAWVIPVGGVEIEQIKRNGSDAFSRLLQQKDPDLLDWKRSEMM